MALIFMEGFDKYGVPNGNTSLLSGLLTQGDWTTAPTGGHTIVTGLSSTGGALQLGVAGATLNRSLGVNYSRLIAGIRFNSSLVGSCAVSFLDGAAAQCSVTVNASTGTISIRNGALSGTVIATSTAVVPANSTHYLEMDITFSNTGAYQVWLDGISILSGTGDTTATANNFANQVSLQNAGGSPVNVFDDFYLFDTSGTVNNAVLLTSPRIETTFPTSDATVQFGIGASILGSNTPRSLWINVSANFFVLRPVTPTRNCTLNSLGITPGASSGAINLRGMVYSDNAGAPGTLLTSGSTVTGMTLNTVLTLPLATPQSLTAGTQYWIGHMSDIAVTTGFYLADALVLSRSATVTFSSGAPSTAPATVGASTDLVWGNITGVGVNWYEVTGPPPQLNTSYVFDATVGHEDLYNFNSLSIPPIAIYAVAVKAHAAKTDAGPKTFSVRLKSGTTDSGGTGGTQAPGTSYTWFRSHFETDPNTGAAWTLTALNAAQSGVKVES